jgi:hypothetical protein
MVNVLEREKCTAYICGAETTMTFNMEVDHLKLFCGPLVAHGPCTGKLWSKGTFFSK